MALSGSWTTEWPSGYWSGWPKGYRWTGNWSKSGNTVTLSNMTLQIIMLQGSGSGTASDTVVVTGGTAQTVNWTMSGASSNVVGLNNTSFAVTSTSTSVRLQCDITGETTGYMTINYDPSSSAPTGLAASNITPLADGFSATVSVTSWGTGGSADPNDHYKELSIFNQGSLDVGANRKNRVTGTALSDTIVTDNSSSWLGSLVVQPNTVYTLGIYATNGNDPAHGQTGIGDYTTLALPPTLALDSVTDTTATLSYSTQADGGRYTKEIEYSLDGITWTIGATVSSGSAASGSFTVSGLSAGTTYNVQTRVTTAAGSNAGNTVTVTTSAPVTNAKFYGSIKTVEDISSIQVEPSTYPAISGVVKAALIEKLNSEGAIIAQLMEGREITSIVYSAMAVSGGWSPVVRVNLNNGESIRFTSPTTTASGVYSFFSDWGGINIPLGQNDVTSTVTVSGFSYANVTISVGKIYGSLSGQTKLIKKIYGSRNGVTKTVYEA